MSVLYREEGGRQVEDLLGPVEMTPRELAGIALDGRSARFGQVVRRTADGEPIPVELTISPIVDEDRVVGLSRISHDLRRSIEARQRLERSEALLADAAEIGGMGSWELDRTTGEATWSSELYRLAWLDPGTAVTAKTLVELAHPDDREGLAWSHAQVGELDLQLGRLRDARDAFTAASQAFPGHPFAVIGYAKVLAAEGTGAREHDFHV